MQLIAFAGYAGVGKDACAEYLSKRHGFYHARFADPIKAMVGSLLNIPARRFEDREWKEAEVDWLGKSPRHLMQTLGTEWGRELVHPDLWVIATMHRLRFMSRVVLSDCRFDNEAMAVRAAGGRVIQIIRSGSRPVNDHKSETALSSRNVDRILINDGSLDQLFQRLEEKIDWMEQIESQPPEAEK